MRPVLVVCLLLAELVSCGHGIIRITSPRDGTVVHPGDTINVTVSTSGGIFTYMEIEAAVPIENQSTILPPYHFRIHIPREIRPGMYTIMASGTTRPGHNIGSQSVSLDVERADLPISLETRPFAIKMGPGSQIVMNILGKYNDGSTSDLTNSKQTQLTSLNPDVVTVVEGGLVSTRKPGQSEIVVRVGSQAVRVMVDVANERN